MIERLTPEGTPTPRGPYSPAVRAGDFVFVSGQGPVNPSTDKIETGDVRHETRLVLGNIQRILAAAGASMSDVVKCQVYLRHGGDFAAMNEAYGEFFDGAKPARTTVVTGFAAEINVEIDAIAYKPAR